MTLKLTYFDIRGLAEPIRLLLNDQEISFEDNRISREDWAEMKPAMIFAQLPCLHIGTETIVQSAAILRHLGRVYGLNGSTESDTSFIDMFSEGLRDLRTKYSTMIKTDYEDGKEAYITETLPGEILRIEKLFCTFNNGENFVAGDKLSYADYALFELLDIHLILTPTALDGTPALKRFHGRFAERPNMRLYLNKRAELNPFVSGNGKQ